MNQRTILITGCSSGIGHHAAHALHARGWRVFASCRRQADCDRLIGEGLESPCIDYQDEASIAQGLEEVLEKTGGRLDALFNNGAYGIPGAVEDFPTDAIRELFEANFFGWHELTRRVIPVMRRRGEGRIVQCSSVLGFIGLKMRAPYVASKHALEGYTDVLRHELKGSGIQVVLIEPGPINTDIRIKSQPHYERWIKDKPSVWADFYKNTVEPRLYATDPPADWGELQCDAVTAKLVHALERKRAHPRYYVTTPTYVAGSLKRILPTRVIDWILG
ncbi:SDR family NAD(P)-dependent oxidoreductase [Rhodobacteraceae bacterium NNCM2]|nr:SDR family NAD(P)-dependent oxidoreductase [Coraliihabitans acroporae]